MLSVVFVLAATLTLLPAVLAKLGPRVDKLALPWVHSGEHRSPRFARWGERLWRRPLAVRRSAPSRCCSRSPLPVLGAQDRRCRRSRSCPRTTRSRQGYEQVQAAVRPRCARARCRSSRRRPRPTHGRRGARGRPGHRTGDAAAARPRAALALDPGGPDERSVRPGARRDDRPPPRRRCPPASLVGGAVAENHDLEAALAAKTPLVIGVVLGARLPAAAGRAAGAADRRARRRHQPARDRRRLRRRAS